MSFLAYPDVNSARNLHVWNNAAFDEEETEELECDDASSRCPLQSVSLNGSDSFDSNSSKENQRPQFGESPVNPVQAIGDGEKLHGKPLKLLFEQGLIGPFRNISNNDDQIDRSEGEIDSEMREIAMEISRLASKLEALRLEKEKSLKKMESSERRLVAENGDQTQSMNNQTEQVQSSKSTASRASQLRPSMNPETTQVQSMQSHQRKSKTIKQMGIGLGASETIESIETHFQLNQEKPPIQSTQALQDRTFKLSEIDEDKVTMRRGGRSLSPMKRWSGLNIKALPKQGFATVGPKQLVRNNNGALTNIKPKNLFNLFDEEKGVANATIKKLVQRRRVVASRYNQIPAQFSTSNRVANDQRKRPCPENEDEKSNKCDKRRASLVAKVI